jgi:membrane-associated phospholipid phosphatase
MSTQHDLTAEVLQQHTPPAGRSYTVARLISGIFHPLVLSSIGFFLVGVATMPQWLIGLGWALLGISLQIIPSTIFYMIRLRQGIYTDEDVSVRQQRNELYIFSMFNMLIGLQVLFLLQAPLPFIALVSSAALLAISAWFINLFWKISIHASSAASCATVALIYDQPLGLALCIAALMVGWARIRTNNHTPAQVLAGYGLAALCVWMAFRLFGLV